jgi:hypothetical protein
VLITRLLAAACVNAGIGPLGFTILDNVIMFEGTFYIVVDDPASMPPIESIASSRENKNDPPRDVDWQIFPGQNAFDRFDSYGGRCVAPFR